MSGAQTRLDGTKLVVRILRLALLAPDIMEDILARKADARLMLESPGRPSDELSQQRRAALLKSFRHALFQ